MNLSFSEQYRTMLKRTNKTATEVAVLLGVTRQNLSSLLAKDDLRFSQMKSLCDAIGADLNLEITLRDTPTATPIKPEPRAKTPTPKPAPATPKQDPRSEVLNPSAPPDRQYTRAMVERWKINKPNWDTPEEEQTAYDQYLFDTMQPSEEDF